MHLLLVRHAEPVVDLGVPSSAWTLSAEGLKAADRLGLFLKVDCGSRIWCSSEVKARETAQRIAAVIGAEVAVDHRLSEVSRPVAGNEDLYRQRALEYLRGGDLESWEPRSEVLARFSAAIDDLLDGHDGETLIAITHGIAMTLYIASRGATSNAFDGGVDPAEFWSRLEMPDAWQLDLGRNWLDRIGFTWDGMPISREPPHGAAVLVYRRAREGLQFLLLHRTGAEQMGDWAWTPPTGARFPGEDVLDCARRELSEEAGLDLTLVESPFGSENWPQFLAEAPDDCLIRLSDEHDRWEWVEAAEACERCLPAIVSNAMRRALEHLRAK